MKSKTQILRGALAVASLSLMTLLTTGCGMKGGLYLPAPAASAAQPTTPPSK
ncbi:MAG: lipoprotein [Aquabacterium sp.]